MPVSSSSIPSLITAGKVRRRRRRKRYASGGSPTNPALWGVDEEELPAGSGLSPMTSAAGHIAKSVLWDLPHKAIDAAKGTSYGLRREDFTDVPPDYSPDPNSPLGSVGIAAPKGAWQPTDDLIGASLEGATNVMGGTALGAPAKAAGEMVVGAGPRDPALWHGISKVRLPKPISEMSAVHVPTQQVSERVINPASLQGGKLLPLLGDRTGSGTNLMQVNGYKFADPVSMQGGHGFMAANEGTGAAWASGKPIASGIANRVAREGADAPVYGVYTAMGERSGDFSHHVSDALSEMLPHTNISKTARRSFDDEMREVAPDWPGLKSEALRPYLADADGGTRKAFVELMDTAKYQKEGFPSVAEARFATTDPRLLDAKTGDSDLSIAKMEGRSFTSPGQHRTYDTNVGGQYVGGLPESVPKEVMYPDIIKPLEAYRDALPGYKPTTDYLMARTPKGLPVTQEANQKWVDTVSQHLQKRGFTLGAGATDKRAAAVAAMQKFWGQRSFASEQEARDTIMRRVTADNERYAGMFPPTDPSLIDDLKFVRQGKGVKVSSAGTTQRKPIEIMEEPTGNAAPVDWTGPDLMHNGTPESAFKSYGRGVGEARQGYINEADLPKEKLAGGRGSYDWEELQSRKSAPPPPTIRINKNGTATIMDGNHRIAYWREQGYDQIPAFIIDERKAGKVLGSGATDKRAASLSAVDDILESERRLAGATHEPAPNLGTAERPAPATDPAAVGPRGGGAPGARSLDEAQATAARWAGARPTLEGQQGALKIGGDYFVPGPIGKIHDVAEDYMRTVHPDRPYTPPTKYHPVDPEHAQAIAKAYEDMPHTPNDPATKASYDALIDETTKQYQAIKATGLKIEPIPAGMPDPYATNPRLAARDVAENNHLWFFPTEGGFGTVNKITDNPMLRKTGEKIGDHELLANDMFRVVHDYFGHLKEGHGFRAAGEDNAWRTHSQMYSDLARPAMTTETRGQNSWVNYGPHGEKNRTASGADTTYADQKVGLMPEWTMRDRGSPEPIIAYHGSPYSFDRFSMDKINTGEGNQAYGHGLYFAGHSPVSEWYRHQLAARRDPMLQKYGLDSQDGASVGIELANAKGDADQVIAGYRKYADELRAEGRNDAATKNMITRAEAKAAYLADAERSKGHMYEVAIDAQPEHFLDWDKSVLDQSQHVRSGLEQVAGPNLSGLHAEQLTSPAGDIVHGVFGSPTATWDALRKAGVKGIRYLDQFSRGKGGSHNYVAFDDNMVKILRKYGIVGIPAAGVLGVDGEERRATGGKVEAALGLARKIKREKGGRVHVGPIVGDTGGRADKVPMSVPDGAYVIPADIVSGLGEGNTAAGMVQIGKMFPKSKPRIMRESPGAVPILAADGEFVVSPDSILDRWDDLAYGHQALDAWVLHERQQLIETLEGLDPPAQD